MKSSIFGFGAGVIAAALLAGGAAAQNAPVANNELIRIQEYPGTILNLPHWVMMDAGFCERVKLRCEGVAIPSGPVGLQALAAGSIEVSYASTEVTMQSAARGNDVQVIVGHSPNNIYELTVRSDVPLPNKDAGYPAIMKDIVGKKVGVTARGSGVELQVRALLIGAGLDPESVTYVAVGSPATAYPQFVAKQIDAALMFQPFRALCEYQKTCIVAVDMDKGEGPAEVKSLNGGFETYAARRDFIKKNPAAVTAFIHALTEAIAWMQKPENFDQVAAITKKRLSMGDVQDADKVMMALLKMQIPRFGVSIDRDSIKAFSNFLVINKMIDKPFDHMPFIYENAP